MLKAQNPVVKQAPRFALVGILNTLLGVSLIFLCHEVLGVGLVWSNVVGYGAGLVLSFLLNGSWTFGAASYTLPMVLRYMALVAIGFALNIAAIKALLWQEAPYWLAQFSGIFTYSAVVFLGMKYAVFTR